MEEHDDNADDGDEDGDDAEDGGDPDEDEEMRLLNELEGSRLYTVIFRTGDTIGDSGTCLDNVEHMLSKMTGSIASTASSVSWTKYLADKGLPLSPAADAEPASICDGCKERYTTARSVLSVCGDHQCQCDKCKLLGHHEHSCRWRRITLRTAIALKTWSVIKNR